MRRRRSFDIPLSDDLEDPQEAELSEADDGWEGKPSVRPAEEGEPIRISERLPVLPLRDTVIFPRVITPLLVGRERSVRAVQEAMERDRVILLLAQRDENEAEPQKRNLYRVGVAARILQVLKLPNGLFKVLVEGLARARVRRFLRNPKFFEATVDIVHVDERTTPEIEASLRHAKSLFGEYVRLNREIPDDVLVSLEQLSSPQQVTDFISAHILRDLPTKQALLEAPSLQDQLLALLELLESERQILELEKSIEEKVRSRIQRSQRTYYLQEQMRAIQEELGEEGLYDPELAELKRRIEQAGMPKEVEEKALEELEKLRKMSPMSPEATVSRNYLDWLLAVPWNVRTEDRLDLEEARRILDEDHYGLEKPKERILEHLAVLKLVGRMKGPILCFVGPPGVGKTSLGRSIARAMGRKFVRVSLGGVRDEAEIRGHRRTYIGSMPGKIIQGIRRAGTVNPVFLLDEVDKMSADFRGDPSAALLEVLDPEQNRAFNDHYLDVDYDLSEVLFITTANVRHNIPEPLQDRMEIIELPGYLEHEKLEIARGFLIPKQLREHGLAREQVRFTDRAIRSLIRAYTREAGVRNLEREIAAICRKVAREVASGQLRFPVVVTERSVRKYLGVPKFVETPAEKDYLLGAATGLAWTPYGGELLIVEASVIPGNRDVILTGQLGEVMRESARAALTYARAHASDFGIDPRIFEQSEIHIHVPEGAIPKDGPSAGVTMAVALISALSGRKVRPDVAMTGEITLRGNVLAVGGLNEKLLAAQRAGIRVVVVPEKNRKDLLELPKALRRGLDIRLARHIEDVLSLALVEEPASATHPTEGGSQ
ncbi:MAG: endopeptidase La [candidate division KSB1 bacterium]|nr:endopeptidase La [candidate division KSB1 bacterium]